MAKYLHMLMSATDITAGKSYKIERELPDAYIIYDDADDEHSFRKEAEGRWFTIDTADSLEYKRTQLATLTAEIAQLEAQLAEESRLKVGDYARVNDGAEGGRFEPGDVVIVVEVARAESAIYPLGVEAPAMGYAFEAFKREHLTKITPAEARASLIAKIDAHFNPEGGAESRE